MEVGANASRHVRQRATPAPEMSRVEDRARETVAEGGIPRTCSRSGNLVLAPSTPSRSRPSTVPTTRRAKRSAYDHPSAPCACQLTNRRRDLGRRECLTLVLTWTVVIHSFEVERWRTSSKASVQRSLDSAATILQAIAARVQFLRATCREVRSQATPGRERCRTLARGTAGYRHTRLQSSGRRVLRRRTRRTAPHRPG